MAGVWKALVLMVGLAAVACVAQRSLSYEEIVTLTLQFFNQGRQGQPLFGLLEAIPPPTSNFTTVIPLNFRIKERVCLSDGRRQPQDCAFREGGEERTCTGSFLMRRRIRIVTVNCVPDRER
ncbi:15 kDa protein B-like [Diceros bicornis minor]|uniref:15 kDa protein B-like n=1 Tax=Diceros bicornis minor TaxID=77932 RepID=UPI0026F1C8EE|nr:15 kDa protein B-like [Diceros bicornis minor]